MLIESISARAPKPVSLVIFWKENSNYNADRIYEKANC